MHYPIPADKYHSLIPREDGCFMLAQASGTVLARTSSSLKDRKKGLLRKLKEVELYDD